VKIDIPQKLMLELAMLPVEQQVEWINNCLPRDQLLIDAAFEAWHARGQMEPHEQQWRVWLMMAGRGFGKTRAGAEWVHQLASRGKVRIALVGASIDEGRAIMVEGPSGLLSVARRQRQRLKWEPSLGRLTWPRGGVAQLFSGDHADGLRGPEHHFAWCDELAKWRQAEEAWDNLQMGLRAGPMPRALVTTTPRPMPLLERLKADPRTKVTNGATSKNLNLPREFIATMLDTYGGTRLARQELDGELIAEVEGALWTRELIAQSRVEPQDLASFDRVVIGVDPPAGVGEGCDECGIVVAGSRDNALFVLADESVQGLSPEGWSNRVAAAAARWNTTLVVAEANNGGAMVESVLKAADSGLRVRLVHASRGKSARAEPVALKFERGRAFVAGSFPELEAQLCGLVAGDGDYQGPGRSPDRADAMVWALTVLGETRSGVPRVRRL
jgi:phage terminase large subunit-like protein